jgi:AcrR family transcriptional regulator
LPLVIKGAVQLISQQGAEAVTMAAVAQATGVDRKTLYYHFRDRDALLASAKEWPAERLSRDMNTNEPRAARTEHISCFVLETRN